MAGGPKWLDTDRFNIEATPDLDAGAEQVARDRQIRMMLQSLLAERFQLRIHSETGETQAYVIVLAKSGPKLLAAAGPPGPKLAVRYKGQTRIMAFESAPRSYVAKMLSAEVKRAVVDQTGLSGAFDFKLEFVPENVELTPNADTAGGRSIFTAMEEQLGLKLQKRQAALEVRVVDHAEQPSAN